MIDGNKQMLRQCRRVERVFKIWWRKEKEKRILKQCRGGEKEVGKMEDTGQKINKRWVKEREKEKRMTERKGKEIERESVSRREKEKIEKEEKEREKETEKKKVKKT